MSIITTTAIVEINQTANNFQSSIVLRVNNRSLDVKSIIGLSVTLITSNEYHLEIHGTDEEEAKKQMVNVFQKHGLKVELI
ncbi:HPr family phosphocarrier protein [Neobacillus drentensis]|uniref:HPr family phosphocarrier protein n=1 Tax=Neobacillus TaxID=2675232 RepID=UPI0024C0BC7A|nr:HPr family phosphocarrier protein [Neobacillus sp. SuZ13]WHY68949.1 HPr family phosphocarrier protein [Neobacillus sp. SuZ13]